MFTKLGAGLLQARAVSHTQTAQLRTVLQFSPSYPPSPLPPATPLQPNSLLADSGPSSSSSSGGRAGGSKSNRFNEGYTGPGRAVTQANAFLTSYDGTSFTVEELEELDIIPRSKDTVAATLISRSMARHQQEHHLRRRSSMALGSIGPNRIDRAHSFGILSAVRSHVREQHSFAIPQRHSPLSQPHFAEKDKGTPLASSIVDAPRKASSISSANAQSPPAADLPPSLLRPLDPGDDAVLSVRSDSRFLRPPDPPESTETKEWKDTLQAATAARNSKVVVAMAKAYLNDSAGGRPSGDIRPSLLLQALLSTRTSGDPIAVSLELYNDMISRGVVPSTHEYRLVINLLCSRDEEVRKTISQMEASSQGNLPEVSRNKIALLESEKNFESALSLFSAASVGLGYKFDAHICNQLLVGCESHKNINTALRIFAHLDLSQNTSPNALTFARLIRVYQSVGDVQGAEEVFKEFRKVAQEKPDMARVGDPWTTSPWHAMISTFFKAGKPEEAVALLEEMLSAEEQPAEQRTTPPPIQTTYTTIIQGFCETGDMASACAWFDRLLTAEQTSTVDGSDDGADNSSDVEMSQSTISSVSSFGPLPPTKSAWICLLTALHKHNDLAGFTKYFGLLEARKTRLSIAGWPMPFLSHFLNLTKHAVTAMQPTDPQIEPMLQSLSRAIVSNTKTERQTLRPVFKQLFDLLATQGRVALGLAAAQSLHTASSPFKDPFVAPLAPPPNVVGTLQDGIVQAANLGREEDLTMRLLLDVAKLSSKAGIDMFANPVVLAQYVAAYHREGIEAIKAAVTDAKEWEMLTIMSTSCYSLGKPQEDAIRQYQAFVTGLGEVLSKSSVDPHVKGRLATLVGETLENSKDVYSEEEIAAMLMPFGDEAVVRYSPIPSSVQSDSGSEQNVSSMASSVTMEQSIPPSPPSEQIRIGESITRFVDDFCSPEYSGIAPMESYTRVLSSLQHGLYPSPATLARYIPLLAKHGLYEQAQHIYTSSHHILQAIGHDQTLQAQGWFLIEDGMMAAAATAGDVVSSNVFRQRIIEQGGAPSAASYAALIIASKSMTDDATAASSLFAEAQTLGVKPNTYLYNVVISALSRARRADEAIVLFEQMKREGVRWSSVTYGALIGACTRIGDEQTAKFLFDEMLSHSSLKPRVPPFNTMIQMYIQIKPDREQALQYYQMMVRRRIRPTAHTYKLLMDCWGTIQPVNLTEMERVFRQLEQDRDVAVGGPHFASLINAYGCIAHDLDKAISTFESIASKPYVLRAPASAARLPDPVCYEAIINVFVAHRRTDLIRQYLDRLNVTHVHMTAYVANLVIKGMAQCGDMEGARAMFESLEDPPSGCAGHVRHGSHADGDTEMETQTLTDGPVYREPSTWEAMVRAELGAGERERSQELLRRMEARFYPELVLQRVRGLVYPDEDYTISSI